MVGISCFPQYWAHSMATPEPRPIKILIKILEYCVASETAEIASFALYSDMQAMSLRPKKADVLVDRKYILAAMGLLSTNYPEVALRIMKKELIKDGNNE